MSFAKTFIHQIMKTPITKIIYKSGDDSFIYFTTGDSFMDFGYKINYCPICGRKLVKE